MRNWCSRHPVWFMAFYALFYLTFFALLERTIQSPTCGSTAVWTI